ncbi:P-loop containing nucleoside triphosphate hydrolase protein [Chytridium lagenaria]|nr:P-loop containing nucleoside triphosphate hydrolase protein [Chytridium lagenaria]
MTSTLSRLEKLKQRKRKHGDDDDDGVRRINNPQWGLSPRTIARLEAMGIPHLFPVQQAILPKLLKSRYGTSSLPKATLSTETDATAPARHLVLGDLCVSAPTGSGKTLAFALPILEALSSRIITRLRALIVLPTRDLALQVKATFDAIAKGSGLRIALVTGSTSFAAEQAMLVDRRSGRVDILVATPGRLVDHLTGTPGFTLKHLRFLVLDEADRLLSQSYQGWLDLVLKAASGVDVHDPTVAAGRSAGTITGHLFDPQPLPPMDGTYRQMRVLKHVTPFQKLLFSATLTRNPAKIASLRLNNPTYIAVAGLPVSTSTEDGDEEERYSTPETLKEHMIVLNDPYDKPLALFHILFNMDIPGILIFTKSVEAAHRLAALIEFFAKKDMDAPTWARAISSDLTPSGRRHLLDAFQRGRVRALVCSDVMSRGWILGPLLRLW